MSQGSRPYRVTPVLRPGRRYYSASFQDASSRQLKKQVTRGLGTDDYGKACRICAGLVSLFIGDYRSPADVPAGVEPEAIDLYLGTHRELAAPIPATVESVKAFADMPDDLAQWLETLPVEKQDEGAALIAKAFFADSQLHSLRQQLAQVKAQLESERKAHGELRGSILGRAASTAERAPAIPDALKQFSKHMHSATTRSNALDVLSVVNRFLKTVPAEVRKPIDIRPAHIAEWLDKEAGEGKVRRRAQLRRRLARFINWCAKTYEYPSVMPLVPGVKKVIEERERGGIHWHDQKQIEAAIKKAPDTYWKAVIATLAYAGLQLAELAWLRPEDLQENNGGWQLWVDTVADGDAVHALKTSHRRRAVRVDPKHLLPRLRAHLDAGGADAECLFPMPEKLGGKVVRRRVRTVTKGSRNRWNVRVLSKYLVGDIGCKSRKGHPGILPSDMSARSLRRSFGSMLLRSGRTTAEVAAAMGNTEAVVRSNYARILGSEVAVNL